MRAVSRRRERRRLRALPLTALIDVVFILLVFFMLASRLVAERALPLSAAAEGGGGGEGALLVEALPDGYRLGGEALDAEGLAARLSARLAIDPTTPVVLRTAPGADVQRVVSALDAMAAAGVADAALLPSAR